MRVTTSGCLMMLIIMASCTKTKTGYELENQISGNSPRRLIVQSGSNFALLQLPKPIHLQQADIHSLDDPNESQSSLAVMDSIQISHIFESVLAQGHNLWGRYFASGQFTYANAVRRYISNTFHVECEKLFVFGKLTGTSPWYDCSASWDYDVACVLRATNKRLYVIDPRMFTTVVTSDRWLQAHTVPTVSMPHPTLTHYRVTTGRSFTPLDAVPTGYTADSTYQQTDAFLSYYHDSVGCNCQLPVL